MTYEPKHLKRWTMPPDYAGEVWPNYYSAGIGQHRDSDALERANFKVVWAALEPLATDEESVVRVREGHWAVGWVEWIAINADNDAALKAADELIDRLAQYPSLDDDEWAAIEDEEMCEVWAAMSVRSRVEACQQTHINSLEARRPWPPDDDQGRMRSYLLGH